MSDYLRDLNDQYQRLHTRKEDAFWASYMGLADDADAARKELDRLEIEMKRLLQDPARLRSARAELQRVEAEGGDEATKTALSGWVRTFEANVIESEAGRALATEIVAMESRLERARATMRLGFERPGGGFTEASQVKLSVMLATEEDAAMRRAAWEGIRAIEDHVLQHGYLDVVRKRNTLGRGQGAEDYYDWRARKNEGMTKAEIFALLDELEELTRERARASLAELRDREGADAVRPWNVRFFVSGDVTREQDPYFPFAHSLECWGRSFAALGIGYRDAEMVLDLVDRKGKYENGFMHGPVPAWRRDGVFQPARIHFTANAIPGMVGSGRRAIETLFHEGGHAAHFANVDMPAPCFAQEFAPTSAAFAETQSMFLDSLISDADWQVRYAKTKDGTPMPFELIEKGIRKRQPFAAWDIRQMLVVCYGERALYEIPDDELTPERALAALREVEQRLLFVDEAATLPTLAVPHLLSGEGSAYYHCYVLALMAVAQTREFFQERDGHLVDNPRIGPDLQRVYWQPGNSLRFPEFIRNLTGQQVSPKPLAARVNRTADEAVGKARAAVDRLDDIPKHEGAIDLGATIHMDHGNERVASTDAGFEQASAAFSAWIESQE